MKRFSQLFFFVNVVVVGVLINTSFIDCSSHDSNSNNNVVRTCPTTLGVQIYETQIDSPVIGKEEEEAITWLKSSPLVGHTTIFLVTQNTTLWRSKDSGRNWEQVTLAGASNTAARSIVVSPDGLNVVVLGFEKNLWITSDYGNTMKYAEAPAFLDDFKFHPLNPSWVIAKTKCIDCDLYLSQDYGVHWALIRKRVIVADWHGLSDDEKMIVSWEYTDQARVAQLVTSKTFFRTDPLVSMKNVLGYKSIGSKIFVAISDTTKPSLELLVSENFGETFQVVRFPLGLQEMRYTLIDTTEGSTFINVQHWNDSWGNVYASNAFDDDFVLTLERNPRESTGKSDFKSFTGLEGIYIANQYVDDISFGKQTFITYDKGGKWDRLPQPGGFTCTSKDPADCRLNIIGAHGPGRWYTNKQAIGLILATGSVSNILMERESFLGVYFSRDAGWTWKYVRPGKFTYEMGNHGGLLLMSRSEKQTWNVTFSKDQGNSWEDCDFTDSTSPIEVTDIVSDPELEKGIFLMYGTRNGKGVLVCFDFTSVHQSECKGHDAPNTKDSDYETFEPSDIRGSECLLGRRTDYIRRKQNVACTIPELNQTDVIVVKNCSCTPEDYQCDYCYVMKDAQCIPDPDPACSSYDPKAVPSPCKEVYFQTQGYRQVPGDTCDPTSGTDLTPLVKPCPGSPPTQTPSLPIADTSDNDGNPYVVVIFVVIAAIVVVLGGLWWFTGKNGTLRDFATKCIPEAFLPDFETERPYETVNTNFADDLEEDAPEIDLDDSTTTTTSSTTNKV